MPDFPELLRIGVPAVLIPLGVFGANWLYRQERGYSQTAAADFILCTVIFDGGVVAAAKDFGPFVHSEKLQALTVDWHIGVAIVSGFVWAAILKWGEPAMAGYYGAQNTSQRFPIGTFLLCWIAVFFLISIHVGFFLING